MVKFTIMNDLSARTLQMEEMVLSPGPAKGKDSAANIGPGLVTPDELAPFCVSTPNGNMYDLRRGCDYYCRAGGEAVFWVKRPTQTRGIGIDSLPEFIRNSDILTGNNLGQLGNSESVPSANDIAVFQASIVPLEGGEPAFFRYQRHREYAKMLGVGLHIAQSDRERAAKLIMIAAKCALDCDDVDFGWKAALVARRLSQ